MGYTRDALHGLATLLASSTTFVYRDTGAYAATETGIVIGTVPQGPPAVVCLIPYPLTDDPTLSDSVMGLQIRFRVGTHDPRDVTDLADEAFDALHGHPAVNLSTTARLLIAERISGVPLGEDANGHPEWSDNYQLTLHRPSAHRA